LMSSSGISIQKIQLSGKRQNQGWPFTS